MVHCENTYFYRRMTGCLDFLELDSEEGAKKGRKAKNFALWIFYGNLIGFAMTNFFLGL